MRGQISRADGSGRGAMWEAKHTSMQHGVGGRMGSWGCSRRGDGRATGGQLKHEDVGGGWRSGGGRAAHLLHCWQQPPSPVERLRSPATNGAFPRHPSCPARGEGRRQLVPGVGKVTPWPRLAGFHPHRMPAATSTQHFPLLQAQIPFSRFIFTESLKYDWGDVTAVFSRSRRYHSPERAPKIKYFMSKNMKIIPRKDPRLPPSWTLLGEAPKSDKNRGLHFLCKKGGKKLQYFGLFLIYLDCKSLQRIW